MDIFLLWRNGNFVIFKDYWFMVYFQLFIFRSEICLRFTVYGLLSVNV